MRKSILENIHETAKDFYEAGLMDEKTMRKFDAHCLEPAKKMSKHDVKRIRAKTHASQPVFASYLNVTAAAVKQWEKGERTPGGASARLLQLIDHKGLDVFEPIQVIASAISSKNPVGHSKKLDLTHSRTLQKPSSKPSDSIKEEIAVTTLRKVAARGGKAVVIRKPDIRSSDV